MVKRLKETDWIDVCWHECKSMWRYVSRNSNTYLSVSACKKEWLKANGYDNCFIPFNCFFCHHTYICSEGSSNIACAHCPGKTIDKNFDCTNVNYHYKYLSKKFYRKICELDKKRKEHTNAKSNS